MASNDQEYIYDLISKIVKTEIANQGLLKGDWQLGTIHSIINSKRANVFINGSSEYQQVPSNPDVTFHAGDHVFVVFINGDSRNKYVISRRAV